MESKTIERAAISLTFGEQSENHRGMQINGHGLRSRGFSVDDLKGLASKFTDAKLKCELAMLSSDDLPEAAILIIRDGISFLLEDENAHDALFAEMLSFPWDTKAYMYGRVVNKKARHNVCFGPEAQAPNYEAGEGTIVPFAATPMLFKLRAAIEKHMGPLAANTEVEGNLYYDTRKTGIGFHGDVERKVVIAARLGVPIPLVYQWHQDNKKVGSPIVLNIGKGDVYIMSEKATGNDWKKRKIPTLRHAAGSSKFTGLVG